MYKVEFFCWQQPTIFFFRVGAKSVVLEAAKPKKISVIGQSMRIFRHIFKTEGLRGLYRGYLVSLATYGSNSAFYWGFYYLYSEVLEGVLPHSNSWLREQLRIVSAGLFGSTTAVLLTNPLDVVRTRYQLQVCFYIYMFAYLLLGLCGIWICTMDNNMLLIKIKQKYRML